MSKITQSLISMVDLDKDISGPLDAFLSRVILDWPTFHLLRFQLLTSPETTNRLHKKIVMWEYVIATAYGALIPSIVMMVRGYDLKGWHVCLLFIPITFVFIRLTRYSYGYEPELRVDKFHSQTVPGKSAVITWGIVLMILIGISFALIAFTLVKCTADNGFF